MLGLLGSLIGGAGTGIKNSADNEIALQNKLEQYALLGKLKGDSGTSKTSAPIDPADQAIAGGYTLPEYNQAREYATTGTLAGKSAEDVSAFAHGAYVQIGQALARGHTALAKPDAYNDLTQGQGYDLNNQEEQAVLNGSMTLKDFDALNEARDGNLAYHQGENQARIAAANRTSNNNNNYALETHRRTLQGLLSSADTKIKALNNFIGNPALTPQQIQTANDELAILTQQREKYIKGLEQLTGVDLSTQPTADGDPNLVLPSNNWKNFPN